MQLTPLAYAQARAPPTPASGAADNEPIGDQGLRMSPPSDLRRSPLNALRHSPCPGPSGGVQRPRGPDALRRPRGRPARGVARPAAHCRREPYGRAAQPDSCAAQPHSYAA